MALIIIHSLKWKMLEEFESIKKELNQQSEAMHVKWIHTECRGDVHTSVCSAAVTKHGPVAAGLASTWEVMAGHAKDQRMSYSFFMGKDAQELLEEWT